MSLYVEILVRAPMDDALAPHADAGVSRAVGSLFGYRGSFDVEWRD